MADNALKPPSGELPAIVRACKLVVWMEQNPGKLLVLNCSRPAFYPAHKKLFRCKDEHGKNVFYWLDGAEGVDGGDGAAYSNVNRKKVFRKLAKLLARGATVARPKAFPDAPLGSTLGRANKKDDLLAPTDGAGTKRTAF